MVSQSSRTPVRRRPALRRFTFWVFLACSLAACAPHLELPGRPYTAPQVNDDIVTAPDGAQLPLRAWEPEDAPRAIILALHGFNDYSNAFEDAGQMWADHGIATYAYDQRGFGGAPNRGLWAGNDAYVEDLRMVARLLRHRHPGVPFYILGESMGGAVVMLAMTSGAPPEADGIILVAPAVWGRDYMPFYQTASLWFAAHTFPWARVTGEGLSIRPSDNIEMLRKFSRDPMVIKETRIDAIHGLVDLMDAALESAPKFDTRSLILYGRKDEIVPDNPTFAMIKQLPRHNPPVHRVAVYDKGYHMLLRDLQGETVMRDVVAWIDDPDRPLPSGADQPVGKPWQDTPPLEATDDKQHAPGLLPGVERP